MDASEVPSNFNGDLIEGFANYIVGVLIFAKFRIDFGSLSWSNFVFTVFDTLRLA